MRKLLCLLTAFALLAAPLPAQQPPEDPEVAKGVREVEEGELDAGIFTLDAAARRLLGNPAGRRELGRAYLYLGIAFVGKAQETLAKARFRDALQQQGALSLSPDQFPPKVIALFETARQELTQAGLLVQTPLDRVSLRVGSHTIHVEHPAYQPLEGQVTIRAGETSKVSFDFTKDGVRRER